MFGAKNYTDRMQLCFLVVTSQIARLDWGILPTEWEMFSRIRLIIAQMNGKKLRESYTEPLAFCSHKLYGFLF